jgi:hypothetical protein
VLNCGSLQGMNRLECVSGHDRQRTSREASRTVQLPTTDIDVRVDSSGYQRGTGDHVN